MTTRAPGYEITSTPLQVPVTIPGVDHTDTVLGIVADVGRGTAAGQRLIRNRADLQAAVATVGGYMAETSEAYRVIDYIYSAIGEEQIVLSFWDTTASGAALVTAITNAVSALATPVGGANPISVLVGNNKTWQNSTGAIGTGTAVATAAPTLAAFATVADELEAIALIDVPPGLDTGQAVANTVSWANANGNLHFVGAFSQTENTDGDDIPPSVAAAVGFSNMDGAPPPEGTRFKGYTSSPNGQVIPNYQGTENPVPYSRGRNQSDASSLLALAGVLTVIPRQGTWRMYGNRTMHGAAAPADGIEEINIRRSDLVTDRRIAEATDDINGRRGSRVLEYGIDRLARVGDEGVADGAIATYAVTSTSYSDGHAVFQFPVNYESAAGFITVNKVISTT